MSYQILIESAAARQFKKLPVSVQKDLKVLIDSLASNPRPPGCKKLKGRKNEYRVRSGSYRVIYTIKDSALLINVIKIGHRRESYD
ncbi:MAG: type II toxin-antitoxin system RelE/ParE family toxin [Cyanobacteria bacterium J06581_3]